MPKHIKILKHPETQKFYVSDVCEFHSVEVCGDLHAVYNNAMYVRISVFSQELVAYYQQNSLGSSFPGVDTTLSQPYHDVADTAATGGGGTAAERRSRSTSIPPAPNFPPPSHPPLADRWAEVLFNFTAEYPDELTIDVSNIIILMLQLVRKCLKISFRGTIGSKFSIRTQTSLVGG